jgi:Ca-activated chloride channel family protein
MRKPLLSLGLAALIAVGCNSASMPAGPAASGYVPPPPEHYQPTPYPVGPAPSAAATPYDGLTFADPGENPFIDPRADNQSTFGLDVDTASYTVARRFIDDGNLPDPASVRVEEFVNYFDQGYAPPDDDAFAIHADGGPSPFLAPDETLLRIGVKARDVAEEARPSAALTFVIDVSGSMSRESRLELVKQSLGMLVEMLRRDDTVGIVAYGTDARVVLPPTRASDGGTIMSAVGALQPGGSTNAAAGLALGYEMARENFVAGGINRVVLASDGVANVGATDADTILSGIRDGTETGIQLVAIGVGMGNFNDVLLERLADDGDGFYAYVDDLDEARRVFVSDLTGTLQSVALDARAQVDFDRANVEAYRLVGYENRAFPDDQFRNDGVNAGAIGAGHQVTALYAVRLSGEGGPRTRVATVSLRWTDPATDRAAELAQDVLLSDLASAFGGTAPAFKLDVLVAATAERFRGSPWGGTYRLKDVQAVADELANELPRTEEVRGFLTLLSKATTLER